MKMRESLPQRTRFLVYLFASLCTYQVAYADANLVAEGNYRISIVKHEMKDVKLAEAAQRKASKNADSVDSTDMISEEVTEENLSGFLYALDMWMYENRSYSATIRIPASDYIVQDQVVFVDSENIQVHLESDAGEVFDWAVDSQTIYLSSLINNPVNEQCFAAIREVDGDDIVINVSSISRYGFFYRISEVQYNEGSATLLEKLGLSSAGVDSDAELIAALESLPMSEIVSSYGLIRPYVELVPGVNYFGDLNCQ